MDNKPRATNVLVRECITTALFQLMEKEEFQKISITDIILKAGVVRVSFYRNYKSKEDVIRSWFEAVTADIAALKSIRNNTYTLEEMSLVSFHFFKEHEKAILLIKHARMTHLIDEAFSPLFNLFEMPAGMPSVAYAKLYYWGGFMSMALEWLESGTIESVAEMAEIYCRLIRHVDAQAKHKVG